MTSGSGPVAAIYDIHGNLTALEAVLADVDQLGVQRIIIGGDIAWGPQPRECVERVMRLGTRARFVRGNADREVASPDSLPRDMPPDVRDITIWCANRLNIAQRVFLDTLPDYQRLDVAVRGSVFFCHGSPRGDTEAIYGWTPEEQIALMIRAITDKTIVCGHTHAHFDRVVDGARIVNAGSVGLHHGPGAAWAIIGPEINLRRTPYDTDLAIRRLRRSGVPGVEEFIQHVRHPDLSAQRSAISAQQ